MITFDNINNLTDVKRYDLGSDTLIDLDVNNFDLFNSGAEIGDYMQFNYGSYQGSSPWHDLYLSISTALSMVATLTWYYCSGGTTWVPLTITSDGTSGFTVSGTVEFDVPTDGIWNQHGSLTHAIKCEITAFASITTVGHVDTIPTIKNWTIIVTDTETMASILAADIAGGWGVVDHYDNVYRITAHLYINGNLTSLNEVVKIGETNMTRYLTTGSDCVLQLGEDVNGYSRNGSTWIYTNNSGSYPWKYASGIWKLYVSEFIQYFASARDLAFQNMTQLYMRDSIMRIEKEKYLSGDVDIIDSILQTDYRIFIQSNDAVFDNVKFAFGQIWAAANYSFTLKNCDVSSIYMIPYGGGSVVTLEDCIIYDPVESQFSAYVNGTGIIKFNFNLIIQDTNGNSIIDAHLNIIDDLGNVIYNSTYSGGEDILLEVFKVVEVVHVGTYTYHNPFTITITRNNYQTYQSIINIEKRTEMIIALQLLETHDRIYPEVEIDEEPTTIAIVEIETE